MKHSLSLHYPIGFMVSTSEIGLNHTEPKTYTEFFHLKGTTYFVFICLRVLILVVTMLYIILGINLLFSVFLWLCYTDLIL